MICHNHTIENEKNQRKCHTRRIFCYENGKRVANRQNDLQPFSYYYVLCSRGNCPPEVISCIALRQPPREPPQTQRISAGFLSARPYRQENGGRYSCHTNPAAAYSQECGGSNTRCRFAASKELTRVRSKRACDNVNQSGFARAVGSQKTVEVRAKVQGDTGKGLFGFEL